MSSNCKGIVCKRWTQFFCEFKHKLTILIYTNALLCSKLRKSTIFLNNPFLFLEYANAQKLQQDHPCVLKLIRNNYLQQPVPRSIPYNLNYPEIDDPSDGQSKGILRLLRNQVYMTLRFHSFSIILPYIRRIYVPRLF